MQKVPFILLFVSLAALAQAGEGFKLLINDKHAKEIISYLQSADIEYSEADPFAEFQESEQLTRALANYSLFMEATIDQMRENIRNVHTTRTADGGPYARKIVELGDDFNVVVQADPTAGPLVYAPRHPHADNEGMLRMPNVNVAEESAQLLQAKIRYRLVMDALSQLEPGLVSADLYSHNESSLRKTESTSKLMIGGVERE
ncbi:flagellar basal body rod protein FlgC [Pelagicoccus albus]|uniref:Uncharacterized protein n=1 Tax=Pelagicoccus albus TaxID=415222 RepID=A0A7X1E9R9_9BACT|nr:hypothetical protein [Pelagicoccus albus]MBC2608150.1 hypothetical protein [Pelagicoccus albus]